MTAAAIPGLKRHFVTFDDRQVHYRRCGKGPPLVLLPPAPLSSAALVDLMQLWGKDFTVIALDLPGTGLSDPAPKADPDGLAWAVAGTINALGLKRAALWGQGPGAAVALATALAEPDRISGVVLDGLEPSLPDDAAFPDLTAREDGSHLVRAWAMLRDAHAFYPWHARSKLARIRVVMPDATTLNDQLIDLLRAGPGWADVPKGVRTPDLAGLVEQLRVPATLILNRARGLDAHQGVLAEIAEEALLPLEVVEDDTAAANAALDFLKKTAPDAPAPEVGETAGIGERLAARYVDLQGGQLLVRFNADGKGVPLCIQHDAASAGEIVAPLAAPLIGVRPVFLPDWPGNGESDALLDGRASVADYAEVIGQLADALGFAQIDHYGMWGGGFTGLELAHQRPKLVRKVALSNVFFHQGDELKAMQAHYTPELDPVWHGGHLLQAWHQMRDQAIWYPWFRQQPEAVIDGDPFIDPAMVTTRVFCLLRAGPWYRTAYQSHFVYPVLDRLKSAPVPTLVATARWDPNRAQTLAAHEAAPKTTLVELGDDITGWLAEIRGWLDS